MRSLCHKTKAQSAFCLPFLKNILHSFQKLIRWKKQDIIPGFSPDHSLYVIADTLILVFSPSAIAAAYIGSCQN